MQEDKDILNAPNANYTVLLHTVYDQWLTTYYNKICNLINVVYVIT